MRSKGVPAITCSQAYRSPLVLAVLRKSARTPEPRSVSSTAVQRARAPSPLTSSTRFVLGHQRGRLWGSRTRSQIRSTSASITRVRETLGIAASVFGLEPAQVANQQQLLQVPADRGKVLERLDGFLAPRLAA